ncbi:MAG: endonuclease domain-containing protein [Desulfobulbaceae bacterium]|nr:endonuclease domain-containing protein [Desulfobulbaceae bacterium]
MTPKTNNLKPLARILRKKQTDAEKLLWRHLRNRQVANCKFRRQFAIKPYIVDFVCLSPRLVIELDGSQHVEAADYDRVRTEFLAAEGFKVLRFWNNEVLEETEAVLQKIYEELMRKEG